MSRQCSIDGCEATHYARGWCKRHYYRARRNNGDPLAFKIVRQLDRFDSEGRQWCSWCREYLPKEDFGSEVQRWCRIVRTIYKYPIDMTGPFAVEMPGAIKVVHVQNQDGKPMFWAEVDPAMAMATHAFEVVGTGQHVPTYADGAPAEHRGTWQDGPFMWHLYEVIA